MRERRRHLRAGLLLTVLAALLASPVVAAAASGLPATVTMSPERAGPGSMVEVVGLDFPASREVELRLTTTAGAVELGRAMSEEGGYFRHRVTLPDDAPPGFWELRATGPGGVVAVHLFESTAAAAAPVEAAPAEVAQAEVTSPVPAGTTGGSVLVLLVVALLVGGIGTAIGVMYYKMHHPTTDPGMASAKDPIWGREADESDQPEPPMWGNVKGESEQQLPKTP